MSQGLSLPPDLRWVDAGNAGPFTLEGTRSYIVGRRRVAVIDPGPARASHVTAVAAEVAGAESVVLLLTHGHSDHAGAAPALAMRLGARILGAWSNGYDEGEPGSSGPLPGIPLGVFGDGEGVDTDMGELTALSAPGHTCDHLVFHWRDQRAVFVGDLLLGVGETTWVGGYSGCVADYFASLDRVENLGAGVLLPAHGPPVFDPEARLGRYRAHRRERVTQVERALDAHPDASADELLLTVYGESVPEGLLPAARASLVALIEYVKARR
ncbi:MAG TPA: MBL fold metallo-hydrolase [Gemmatimonadetes bacterium]|nr:MBL fold metallo-hydrolase [Gemmatimonadota bacterium]